MSVLTVQFQSRTEERTLLSTHAMNVLKVRIDARRNESSYDARRRKVSTGGQRRPAQRVFGRTWSLTAAARASTVACRRSMRASWFDAAEARPGEGVRRRSRRFSTSRLRLRERLFFILLASTVASSYFKRWPASSSGCDIGDFCQQPHPEVYHNGG